MICREGQTFDPLKAIFKVVGLDLCIGSVEIAKRLEFEIYPGELVAVLGRNGVGKSTLLSELAGLRRGEIRGEVLLGGKKYDAWGYRAAACWRGWLPQKQLDQFSASVMESVLSGRHPHLNRWAWESKEDHSLAMRSLDAVGMAAFATRDVMTLSGGERQRVAIATILTQNPSLYFMDEPLSHLDLSHQVEVLNLMREKSRQERISSIMVMHEPGLVYRYCDSALLLFGNGEWLYGAAASVLTSENLSRLYGYPVAQIERVDAKGTPQRWFVPA